MNSYEHKAKAAVTALSISIKKCPIATSACYNLVNKGDNVY